MDMLAQSCLDAMARCAEENERLELAVGRARMFLDQPEAVAALVRSIVATAEPATREDALTLLEAALEEARMAGENGLPQAAEVLAHVGREIERLDETEALPAEARLTLALAFVRAGLEPPAPVMLDPARLEGMAEFPEGVPTQDLGALIEEMGREVGSDPLQLHGALAGLLATFTPPVRAVAVAEMASHPQANFARLGAYWLLDSSPEVREAAAAATLARARQGRMDAIERARLVTVRKWLPADEARALVDQALRESLRREPSGGVEAARPWRLHRILLSLPDGTGGQTVAVAGQDGRRRAVAMLLFKSGFGVKDAYVIPCDSTAAQKRLMAEIEGQTEALSVSAAFVSRVAARALGENVRAGGLPPPGLVDVAAVLGDRDLVPAEADTEALLAALDPDGKLAALTPQKRGRLIGESGDWYGRYRLVDSWFEDSGVVRAILDGKGALRTREQALWRHLEDRRGWWADIIARSAALLQEAEPDFPTWHAFAVTAEALLAGRPLKKTPIMEVVVGGTIAAWQQRQDEHEPLDDVLAWDDEPAADDEPEPGPLGAVEERPGELTDLLARADLSEAWLHGWLVALAVAPKPLAPSVWFASLLPRLTTLDDVAGMQRLIGLFAARAHAVDLESADPQALAARLREMAPADRCSWATGFTACVEVARGCWTRLKPEDRRVLASIADFQVHGMDDAFVHVVAGWLAHRYAKRG